MLFTVQLQQRKIILQALYWRLLLSNISCESGSFPEEFLKGRIVRSFSQIFQSIFQNQVIWKSCVPMQDCGKCKITSGDARSTFLGWLDGIILWNVHLR